MSRWAGLRGWLVRRWQQAQGQADRLRPRVGPIDINRGVANTGVGP